MALSTEFIIDSLDRTPKSNFLGQKIYSIYFFWRQTAKSRLRGIDEKWRALDSHSSKPVQREAAINKLCPNTDVNNISYTTADTFSSFLFFFGIFPCFVEEADCLQVIGFIPLQEFLQELNLFQVWLK